MDWSQSQSQVSGWPMGKGPDKAWERGHKGQGTEHRDMEMEQKTAAGTEMRGSMVIGQSLGREMGQGMATETKRWERIRRQGCRAGKKHLSRDTDMGQGHRDGTEYRGRAWNRDGTGHKDTGMGLTGFPIATGPPALLVGAGSGVGIVSH